MSLNYELGKPGIDYVDVVIRAAVHHECDENEFHLDDGSDLVRAWLSALSISHPVLYEFLSGCVLLPADRVGLNVSTCGVRYNEAGQVEFIYNPCFVAYFLENAYVKDVSNRDFYVDFLNKVIFHEFLHIKLNHFLYPEWSPIMNDPALANLAKDIIVDNLISLVSGWKPWRWRNWEKILKIVGLKPYPEVNSPDFVLNFNEVLIYTLLKRKKKEVEKHMKNSESVDDHSCSTSSASAGRQAPGSTQRNKQNTQSEGGTKNVQPQRESREGSMSEKPSAKKQASQGKGQGGKGNRKEVAGPLSERLKRMDDEALKELRKRVEAKIREMVEKIKNEEFFKKIELEHQPRKISEVEISNALDSTRRYNWMRLFRKALVNLAQKRYVSSWKRINKKFPHLKPGYKWKPRPGVVILAIDVSGSMHSFLLDVQFVNLMSELYYSLKEVARIYGAPSKLFLAQIDYTLADWHEVKDINDLRKIKLSLGGATSYEQFFLKLMKDSLKEFGKRLPDLVIFISDFQVDFSFMSKKEFQPFFRELSPRLFWIHTGTIEAYKLGLSKTPPFGEVIPVYKLGF